MGRIIEELIVKYKTDTSDLKTGLREAKEEMKSLSSAASESSDGLISGFMHAGSSLLDFGAKVGQTIFGLQGLAQGVIGFGESLLGPNASLEQTRVAFTGLLGSAKAADSELNDLQQFAASTPFEFPELADSTQKLLAFQFSLKDTKPLLTAIGDSLSFLGKNTPAYLDQVVNVFGQMNAAGRIQTQDLMQLTSVGINGFQLLADQMHKPLPVIRDMVSKGLIPAKEGIEMLRAGMEKMYPNGMLSQSQTFNGLMSTLHDNAVKAWTSFTSPLFNEAKKGLETLGNLASSKAFQDFATTMGKDVAGAFGKLGTALEPAKNVFQDLQHFVQGFDFSGISGGIDNLKSSIGGLFAPLQGLKNGMFGPDFWHGVDGAIKGFITGGASLLKGAFNGIGDTIRYLTPVFYEVAGIVGGVFSDHFKTASGIVKELGGWFNNTLMPAFEKAKPGFEHLADAVTGTLVPGLAKLWAIGQSVYDKVAVPLAHIFEIAGPPIVRLGGIVSDGLAGAFEFLMPYVLQAGQAVGDFAGGIADRVVPIVSNFFDTATHALDDFQKYWGQIWPYMSGTVMGVWDAISGTVEAGWSLVSGIVDIGLDILAGNWGQMWDDMAQMFAGFWNGLVTSMAGPLKLVGINADNLKITVDGHFADMSKNVSGTADKMKTNVTGSAHTMRDNVNSSFDQMLSHGTTQSQALDDKATSIMKGLGLHVTKKFSDLDQDTQSYWSDIAAYIEQKSKEAADKAQLNLDSIHMTDIERTALGLQAQHGFSNGILNHNFIDSSSSKGYAEGGTNIPTGRYKVGERGWEYMDVPGGASIYSHEKSMRMSSESYPVRSMSSSVAPGSSSTVASSGGSRGQELIIILEMDDVQVARANARTTDRLVRLKLGAKGRAA